MELAILNWPTRDRIMFYGFRTTEDWLIDYAITHRAAYGVHVTESPIMNLRYALNILHRQTGIYQLRLKTVLPENKPVPPAPQANQRIGPLPEAEPPIVVVCSTFGSSFHKRPSQVKVDHLKKILDGGEPQWWINDSCLGDHATVVYLSSTPVVSCKH